MTSLNNDQLTKAVKSVASQTAQNKRENRNLWIAFAALTALSVLVIIAMFLNVNASNRVAAALEQQSVGGTQDALLTRCLAVVAYEGVDNDFEGVVDFCLMDRKCSLENTNATAAAECVDRNFAATRQAELQNSP